MDAADGQTAMAEDLSESSESSSSSSSSSADGPSEPVATLPSFHPYKSLDELSGKPDDNATAAVVVQRFGDYASRLPDGNDLPIALDKPKDYAQRSDAFSESSASAEEPARGLFRGGLCGGKELQGQKEAMYSFCREIREIRQKNLHAAAVAHAGKDLELIKTYGLPLDRMKDFGGLARIGSIALDRLRAAPLRGESSEPEELKTLQHLQSRSGVSGPGQVDATMAFERLRHAHPLFQGGEVGSNNGNQPASTGQFAQHVQPQQQPHPHHHHHHHHHAITQITQMQHAGSQHQQQHQQQPKSFTIDAILGLRGAGQRDKHQRHHQYRKHQGQEGTTKNLSSSSCPNGSNGGSNATGSGGKLKRVRTIFTAEQLERLEGEFARQQYMVGPERLYLAHALRLTEAQVKVWFQNRRIKWRKLNHEQQSQRLHDLHQTAGMSAAERDDSSENAADW